MGTYAYGLAILPFGHLSVSPAGGSCPFPASIDGINGVFAKESFFESHIGSIREMPMEYKCYVIDSKA